MACFGGGILENDEAADFLAELRRKMPNGKLKAIREAFRDCARTPSWPVLNYCEPENAAAVREDPSVSAHIQLLRVPRSWIGGPYLRDLPVPDDEDIVDAFVTEGEVLFFRCAAAAYVLADTLTHLNASPKDLWLGELSPAQSQRLATEAKGALERIAESGTVRDWFSACASLELYSVWLAHVSALTARLAQASAT